MKFDSQKLVQLKRPNFFEGKVLTAEDLGAEQEYARERHWQHNRLLHGYGIVVGLEVGLRENEDGSTQVLVSPGFALDGWGREIVVNEQVAKYLPGDRHDLTVFVTYVERPEGETPTASALHEAAWVVEDALVSFEPSASERVPAAAVRSDFAIAIARLRRPHQNWQRDKNFRPPRAR